MKNSYQSIAALALFAILSTTSSAETAKKTEAMPPKHEGMGMQHGSGGMGGMGGMGMRHGMGMMDGMTEEQRDQHMRAMQDHMLQMHDLSNQILAEKDPSKKEALKTQQLQLMKSHHAQMMESHSPMKEMPKK